MTKRHSYFCLEEANALVPGLNYQFQQLSLVRHAMQSAHRDLLARNAQITPQGIEISEVEDAEAAALCEQYFAKCQAYEQIIEDVLALGVEIADEELGVVIFYSWWENEEVVLSWQFGEDTVQYWHDPGEGFTARRPIRQLFFDAPLGDYIQH